MGRERFVMMTLAAHEWFEGGRKLYARQFRQDPRIFAFNAALFNNNSIITIGLFDGLHLFFTSYSECNHGLH